MIKALLVDLDGTLADSMETLKEVFFNFSKDYGIEATDELFDSLVGTPLYEIICQLKRRYALLPSEEELYLEYTKLVQIAYQTSIKPMANAPEALQLAKEKQIYLALVTAASEEIAQHFLLANDLEHLFDVRVCAQPGELGKPHPDLYLRALKLLGVDAFDSIAIEDSMNGVNAALAADCEVFWLTQKQMPVFDERVYIVRDWLEIKKWIGAL